MASDLQDSPGISQGAGSARDVGSHQPMSVAQLQEQNKKLQTELKFFKEMTRRMQESRVTALEVALQECSTGDKPQIDPDKQSTSLLLTGRKVECFLYYQWW